MQDPPTCLSLVCSAPAGYSWRWKTFTNAANECHLVEASIGIQINGRIMYANNRSICFHPKRKQFFLYLLTSNFFYRPLSDIHTQFPYALLHHQIINRLSRGALISSRRSWNLDVGCCWCVDSVWLVVGVTVFCESPVSAFWSVDGIESEGWSTIVGIRLARLLNSCSMLSRSFTCLKIHLDTFAQMILFILACTLSELKFFKSLLSSFLLIKQRSKRINWTFDSIKRLRIRYLIQVFRRTNQSQIASMIRLK